MSLFLKMSCIYCSDQTRGMCILPFSKCLRLDLIFHSIVFNYSETIDLQFHVAQCHFKRVTSCLQKSNHFDNTQPTSNQFHCLFLGIKFRSKVPGVMITQYIEKLPEGKTTPDFTRKPIALTIQEGKARLQCITFSSLQKYTCYIRTTVCTTAIISKVRKKLLLQ